MAKEVKVKERSGSRMTKPTKKKSKGIVFWPADERPRERLISRGPHALTDAELIAILLRIGVRRKSAIELGRDLLNRFGSIRNMMQAPLDAWQGIKGLGKAHFDRLNHWLQREGVSVRYQLNFLTPKNYGVFFQKLREKDLEGFRSEIDVALSKGDASDRIS
jgi:DNA repair protein RadC